jgi:uncharacterized membrane protein YtjA (UPF0391 family)
VPAVGGRLTMSLQIWRSLLTSDPSLSAERGFAMLWWAIVFLILAIVFGVLGFGVAATMAWVGFKILFIIFIVLLIISLITGWGRRTLP